MDEFLNVVEEYWPLVVAAMPLVFKALNRFTPKWYDQTSKVARLVLQVIDLLDIYKVEKKPEEKNEKD